MKTNPLPPKEFLEECFYYNQDTGNLTWKERPATHFKEGKYTAEQNRNRWNTRYAFTVAGRKTWNASGSLHGIAIRFKTTTLFAHRVIYTLMVGPIPDGLLIDHWDRNPFNNTLSNLRLATNGQNASNQHARPNKTSGLPKGVYKNAGRFAARIKYSYKNFHLGTFDTPELAHASYCSKAKELFGEFACFS